MEEKAEDPAAQAAKDAAAMLRFCRSRAEMLSNFQDLNEDQKTKELRRLIRRLGWML